MTGIPKTLMMSISVLVVLGNCSTIDKAQTIFDETRSGIEENAQVYEEDALNALIVARNFNLINKDVNDRSVAQIVFPKAVKGSFVFGGNYAEGYLIENKQVIAQIRMLGGNIGPNIGGQSYSQITYVMDQETLFEIKNGQKFSLQGTASYAKSGQSVTEIFGQISDGQNLITVIFNQSGYLAGISFEGTYISKKK
jgi:lipid-binding SYLF domain-containing protein